MASIWIHHCNKRDPERVAGNLPPVVAKAMWHKLVGEWCSEASHEHSAVRVFDYEAILRCRGKLAGSLFVEFHSPPSKPERGQPRRTESQP